MPRKLVVQFDGAWNTTKDLNNVIRLSGLLAHAPTVVISGSFGNGHSDNSINAVSLTQRPFLAPTAPQTHNYMET